MLARSDRTKHIEEAIHVIGIDQEKGEGRQPRSQGLPREKASGSQEITGIIAKSDQDA